MIKIQSHKKISILVIVSLLSLNVYANKQEDVEVKTDKVQVAKPFYQGEVVKVEQGGSYTYLEVKEHSEKT